MAHAIAGSGGASSQADATYRKVTWRLVPFLMLCYVTAYLDRVNVGFAKLQMLNDLGFSETVYGLGAGIFFIGYFIFEVPSNVILHRVGARIWIARIMITWGLVSAGFVFVRSPGMFYLMRLLLGIAEAGFYPGIILYLTYWYPSERRARMIALFMTAIPLSGVIGGPLSGAIMAGLDGARGMAGWQWLFVLEAVPSIAMGLVVLGYLDNGIRAASWLTEDERTLLERNLEADVHDVEEHASMRALFADRRIWIMCFIYFTCSMGQYGLTFWMPTLVQSAGVQGVLAIGLLTAVPYIAAAIAMLLFGWSADRHRERRWHLAVPLLMGAAGLTLSAIAGSHTAPALVALTIAAAGVLTSAPLFWSLPTAFLRGIAAAAGIATINSVANLAGFVSPYLVGWLKDVTHSTEIAMFVLSAVLVLGAATVFTVPARLVNR